MSSCSSCHDKTCSAKEKQETETVAEFEQRQRLQSNLCRIKDKIVVLSGKGGVGKSTVAVNLAQTLTQKGYKVGLLDVDVHGPSVPTLLGLSGHSIRGSGDGVDPLIAGDLKVMSVGFLLQDENEAVIWRGPAKYGVIKQLLATVNWGHLDYLVVDCPPGTGDEPLATMELLGDVSGAVIVTTPQDLALCDVRRSITFCRRLSAPIYGVIENMSGFVCPHCLERIDIFKSGGSLDMTQEMGVKHLGSLPIMPEVVRAGDAGTPISQSSQHESAREAFEIVFKKLMTEIEEH
jgi:ATP-binding protein involved in chromosome partitioning